MGSLRKALIAVAIVGAWAGVGSALFVLVTPGEERVQAMLKVGAMKIRDGVGGPSESMGPAGTAILSLYPQEMPGHDPRSKEEAARTTQLVLATLQEAAATQENVTWRKNWVSSGKST